MVGMKLNPVVCGFCLKETLDELVDYFLLPLA
jgi:hypothetical protein